MVVSGAPQPRTTYELWRRFSFPTEHGSKNAYAVPTWVADQLNSAYTVMLTLLMVHLWAIIIGFVVYLILKKHTAKLHPLAPTLWNKRSDLLGSMLETYLYNRDRGHWWIYPLLFLILVAWIGQTIMSIVVPPLIIIGTAAPVNATSIYVPDDSGGTASDDYARNNSILAARFALEVPWALRALGGAEIATDELREKVSVSQPKTIGIRPNGDSVLRIDYGYRVTGADWGLQKWPTLALTVIGSCVTEYDWFNNTVFYNSGDTVVAEDHYEVFDVDVTASLFQGLQPVANFYAGNVGLQGTLETSNNTYAIVVSSVNRSSFSIGTDPWYLTGKNPTGSSETGTTNTVLPARPVLSCWQDDVWSYNGHNSAVDALTPTNVPGLTLTDGLQFLLVRFLGEPMIRPLGERLGASALRSSTTSLGQIFDAAASSIHNDLERLVLAAFIATTNVFTDSTLYPPGADLQVRNAALGDSGALMDGVADFVVWTDDASVLSLPALIAIPTVLAAIWLCSMVVLYWTPVGVVNALESNNMFQHISTTKGARPKYNRKDGPGWESHGTTAPEPELAPQHADTLPRQDDEKGEAATSGGKEISP